MVARTFLLVVVGILGFLSSLLGFIAEGKKLTESSMVHLPSDVCVHQRSPAMGLGMAAAILLLSAQIISNSFGGCICCESGISEPCGKGMPTAVAIGFLTLSWITFSIAFLLLVAGASINDKRDISDNNYSYGCYVLKSGVFTGAAFASMTTAILGIAYCLQVLSIRKTMAMEAGPSTSSALVTSNGNLQQGRSSQDFMATARPVFPSAQRQKMKSERDRRSAYPRSAVNTKGESRIMEMARRQSTDPRSNDLQESVQARRALGNMEADDDLQGSNQMRRSLAVQQQGYPSPDKDYESEAELNYSAQDAGQSASAGYHINGGSGSEYEIEQEASRPLYKRAGGGSVWEQ